MDRRAQRAYSDGKPFADFLADSAAVSKVDLNIKHQISNLYSAESAA